VLLYTLNVAAAISFAWSVCVRQCSVCIPIHPSVLRHSSLSQLLSLLLLLLLQLSHNRKVTLTIVDTPGSESFSAAVDSTQQAHGNHIRPCIVNFVQCFKHALRGWNVPNSSCQLYKELKSADCFAIVICAAPHFSRTYMQLNFEFADVISKLPDKVAPLTVAQSSFKSNSFKSGSFKSDSFKSDSYIGDGYRLDRLKEDSPRVTASENAAQARHSELVNALQSRLADVSAENSVLKQDKLKLQQSLTQLTAELNAGEQKYSDLVLDNNMLKEENSTMHTMQQQFVSEQQQQTVATLTSAACRHVELEKQIAALQAVAAVREAKMLEQKDGLVAAAVREAALLRHIDELTAAAASIATTVTTEEVSSHCYMHTVYSC
jgi:hypothetical protein